MTLLNVHAKHFIIPLSVALGPLHLNAKHSTSKNQVFGHVFVCV